MNKKNGFKVFLVGDFRANNGPANANKRIAEALGRITNIQVTLASNKLLRMLEMFIGVIRNDVIVICAVSKINIYTIRVAKILKKPVYYIMHGCGSFEAELSGKSEIEIEQNCEYEKYIFCTIWSG